MPCKRDETAKSQEQLVLLIIKSRLQIVKKKSKSQRGFFIDIEYENTKKILWMLITEVARMEAECN
jgi:hypothetical protein